jgi:hypothetical protein
VTVRVILQEVRRVQAGCLAVEPADAVWDEEQAVVSGAGKILVSKEVEAFFPGMNTRDTIIQKLLSPARNQISNSLRTGSGL